MILAPQQTSRHALMDVSRGFGILGILWLNIFIFAMPFEAMVIPGVWGEHTTSNVATWNFVSVFVSGVMRGMISMLFGAAALIMIQKCETAVNGFSELDRYFRRLLLLILFGVIHSYVLLWPHDILYVYGVIGLFIFPFRNLSVKHLSIIGVVMLVASIFLTAHNSSEIQAAQTAIEENLTEDELNKLREQDPMVDDFEEQSAVPQNGLEGSWLGMVHLATNVIPPTDDKPDISADLQKQFEDMAERIGNEILARQGGYVENFLYLAPLTFAEQTEEMLTNHLLDIATFFIFGIILFKLGFFTLGLETKTYLNIAIGGYVIGGALGLITSLNFEDGELLEPLSSAISDYTYDIRRCLLAAANFATIALALRFGVLKFLTRSLEKCGRMALSLYVSQTIICNSIFLGLGLFGQLEHTEIAIIALIVTIAQMLIAQTYFKRYNQGPLENLLRKLIGNPQNVIHSDQTAK